VRPSRVFLAIGVVLLGLCAAWPYRQAPPPPAERPSPPAQPLQLTIRRPDIPLELAPRIEVSPAEGMYSPTSLHDDAPRAPAALSAAQTYALESLAPPPALPVSFQPAAPPVQTNEWRPDATARPAIKPRPPRPYRLRDGDTLEKIAERLLGDAQRAGDIFEANRNVLARPDLLPVGVKIMLPPRETTGELEPVGVQR
jgi:phage tail protein X